MGKASSTKKVARAAGTGGGRTSGGRTPWAYYLAIFVIAAVGSAMVYTSRHNRLQSIANGGTTAAPTVGQTPSWNIAYGIYVCTGSDKGKFLDPIKDQSNPKGISTDGKGLIIVSPKTKTVAGKNATLDKFASAVHLSLNAGQLHTPGGHDYRDGDDCGGKPGQVQVQVFASPTDTTGTTSKVDPALVRLEDQIMLTIAFVPKGTKIPPPPADAIADLNAAAAAATASTSTTTAPATSSTVGGATTVPGATTAPSASTPSATTPTSAPTGSTTATTAGTATSAPSTTAKQ